MSMSNLRPHAFVWGKIIFSNVLKTSMIQLLKLFSYSKAPIYRGPRGPESVIAI